MVTVLCINPKNSITEIFENLRKKRNIVKFEMFTGGFIADDIRIEKSQINEDLSIGDFIVKKGTPILKYGGPYEFFESIINADFFYILGN